MKTITYDEQPSLGFNTYTGRWQAVTEDKKADGPLEVTVRRQQNSIFIQVSLMRDDGGVPRSLWEGHKDGQPFDFDTPPIDGVIEDRIKNMVLDDIMEMQSLKKLATKVGKPCYSIYR